MDVFEFENYRTFVKKRLENAPKGGHGQALKIAKAIGISTTLMSQILNGQREMTPEQGSLLCEYFGLGVTETEYFLLLVQRERAGNQSLKKILDRQIDRIRESAKKVSSRLNVTKVISDEDKAVFYSEWYYSAVRQLTAIPGFENAESISDHLKIPAKIVNETLNFLIQTGLCIEENGRIRIGPSKTHIDSDSPFVKMHHTNWRYKALEFIKYSYPEKLHYSSPLTLSKKDCEKVRMRLLSAIEDVGKIVDPSPSEDLMCLNVDWFKIRPE